MKDYKNQKWTIKDIAHQYKKENPDWDWDKCYKKAKIIYNALKSMNWSMENNNKKYFKHNIPLSYFEFDDSDNEE